MVNRKVEGQEVTAAATPETQRAHVIDLMDALKESLAKRAAAPETKPPAKAKRPAAAAEKPERRVQAVKK